MWFVGKTEGPTGSGVEGAVKEEVILDSWFAAADAHELVGFEMHSVGAKVAGPGS